MTVHEIRKDLAFVVYLMNKDIKMSVEQFNISLEKSIYDVLKKKIGFPFDPTGAETDMSHNDALRRYRTAVQLSLTAGSASLPSDYMRLLPKSCVNISGSTYTRVDYVTEEIWTYKLSHPTLPPTSSFPICKIQGNTMYVRPTSLTTIDFVYIKSPTIPVYAVTLTNGFYNSSGSTELDIDDEFHIDIIRQLLEYLSIPMTNEQVLGYLQQKKMEEH